MAPFAPNDTFRSRNKLSSPHYTFSLSFWTTNLWPFCTFSCCNVSTKRKFACHVFKLSRPQIFGHVMRKLPTLSTLVSEDLCCFRLKKKRLLLRYQTEQATLQIQFGLRNCHLPLVFVVSMDGPTIYIWRKKVNLDTNFFKRIIVTHITVLKRIETYCNRNKG